MLKAVIAEATFELTTGRARFIEEARHRGELFIQQPYELYSAENHTTWRRLFGRMLPHWNRFANDKFMAGIDSLCLPTDRIPRLEEINKFLRPLTGFIA